MRPSARLCYLSARSLKVPSWVKSRSRDCGTSRTAQSCLLIKDPRAENWRLRVVRGDETLRSEHFGSPIVAMDEAKLWRARSIADR